MGTSSRPGRKAIPKGQEPDPVAQVSPPGIG